VLGIHLFGYISLVEALVSGVLCRAELFGMKDSHIREIGMPLPASRALVDMGLVKMEIGSHKYS
jgi:hypothetical protein